MNTAQIQVMGGHEHHLIEHAVMPSINDVIDAQRITFRDIRDHLTGPFISIIAHMIFITILVSIVVEPPPTIDVPVIITDMKITEMEKVPDLPPPPDPEIPDNPSQIEDENFSQVMSNTPSLAPSPGEGSVDVPDDMVSGPTGPATEVVLPNLFAVRPSTSPVVVPGLMSIRTGLAREKALKDGGGSPATEIAVNKALRWLRDHQNPDGSWGENAVYQPAFTGFALLAFLAHGETPSSQEYGRCVFNAIKKVAEYGDSPDPVKTGAGNGYGHQIFTYALCEAFALTKIPVLEPIMNRNIQIIVNGQNAAGGFNYFYNNQEGRCDSSVMGWSCQALKAGFAAGSSAQGLEQAIQKSVQCFSTLMKANSGFVYCNNVGAARPGGEGTPNVTAASTLALQLMGAGKEPAAKDGVNYLLAKYNVFTWKNPPAMEWAIYRWYYQTQVLFQAFDGRRDAKEWKTWNDLFTAELKRVQKVDGHFETPARESAKAAATAGGAVKLGHGENMFSEFDNCVYATSLCCLMLEVYYRYLPTFKVAEAKVFEMGKAEGPVIE